MDSRASSVVSRRAFALLSAYFGFVIEALTGPMADRDYPMVVGGAASSTTMLGLLGPVDGFLLPLRLLLPIRVAGALGRAPRWMLKEITRHFYGDYELLSFGTDGTLTLVGSPELVRTFLVQLGHAMTLMTPYIGSVPMCRMHWLVQAQLFVRLDTQLWLMEDRFGVIVRPHHPLCPFSTERVVELSGTPDGIVLCIMYLLEFCSGFQIVGRVTPYRPINFDESPRFNFGGFYWSPEHPRRIIYGAHLTGANGAPYFALPGGAEIDAGFCD